MFLYEISWEMNMTAKTVIVGADESHPLKNHTQIS